MRVAVIGMGLIGGSIAAALKDKLGAEVVGWDVDHSPLAVARERGMIDTSADSISAAVRDVDAVFVAAPVGRLPDVIAGVLRAAAAGCVVSDVGSTKRIVEPFSADQRFVGGHPLAGAETAGVEHARADLFAGATWYLTPTPTTSGVLYERLHRLIAGIGARPVAISARAHDELLALISHLPHVLANALVAQAADVREGGESLLVAGPSFRDATRVAGANTAIWADIYLANRDALIQAIDQHLAKVTEARDLLAAGERDAVAAWNDAAATHRRRVLEGPTTGEELRELRVPVPNRPGVVAELALALGGAGVNITDLALYPAPDMSDGVVALWVAGEAAAVRAEGTIGGLGLAVFRP